MDEHSEKFAQQSCSNDRFARPSLASSIGLTRCWQHCPPKQLNQRFSEASGCAAANFSGVICTDEIHWQLRCGMLTPWPTSIPVCAWFLVNASLELYADTQKNSIKL